MNNNKPKIPARAWLFIALLFFSPGLSMAQEPQEAKELVFILDVASPTIPLPQIFKPNMDLSGRGFYKETTVPQTLAAKETLDTWQKDLGFSNFYRLQYNLWEIQQLAKEKDAQEKLLNHYEEIIKKINDSGGIVILDLFGTPYGLGRVLDKNSAPHNLKEYKDLVKATIRRLSCQKKYNIWYEVWNAPDIGDFFIGEKSEYLNLYRIVGEAVNELRQETKINIPLGGPSVSAWFKNTYPNNILSPERSLIYELIKYCYSYHLPLDFISWHAYSSDPQEENQQTIYNKPFVKLIRDWLSYFHFDAATPLIIDEWNFDDASNVSTNRSQDSNVSTSYIPARLKAMYEAGIDNQIFFCLEDFGGSKNLINRNLGIFSAGQPKTSYILFQMLNSLGKELFTSKFNNEFVGIIATKTDDSLAILIYNYIDPKASLNYISRNIFSLNNTERKAVLNIIKSDRMKKILNLQLDVYTLRLSPKAKELLKNAVEINNSVNRNLNLSRKLNLTIKGLKETYLLDKYIIDANCGRECEFKSASQSDVDFNPAYNEKIEIAPYSVQLITFKKKPAPVPVPVEREAVPTTQNPQDLVKEPQNAEIK